MEISMEQMQADKILETGILLAAERNYDELLSKIVDCAMDLTQSDGGTLYLYEEEQLKFCIMKNASLKVNRKGVDGEQYPPVAMNEKNVCAYSAIHRRLLNIEDVYSCEEFDFSGPREYDKMTGYHTKSVLVFPLVNHEGNLVGVVQLINAQNEAGEVVPYKKEYEKVLKSLGSQAAVAVSNMRYVQEMEQLMFSITQVFTDAIDTRIPYNYFHSRNVYLYVKMMANHMNKKYWEGKCKYFFTAAEQNELEMSALMHDIGKMVIPNEIINKTTRLDTRISLVLERFDHLSALSRIDCLEGRIGQEEWLEAKERFAEAKKRVEEIDQKPNLDEDDIVYINGLSAMVYTDEEGRQIPYLTPEETECLTVKQGNLTPEERGVICSHVTYTEKYLSAMNFGKRYPHIIEWAGAHHEYLDGSGYPRGLKGDEVPFEARILTIVDVFEALTSADRPYKKSMDVEKAFSVLEDMAEHNKIDKELLGLFKEAFFENRHKLHLFGKDGEPFQADAGRNGD
ncbi:MAG: GAF domain-containing protein [Bacteroidales bacterium]|nr:GAF domain-containing protein [Lachnoclostridium sp.]MCM1384579.1 GAF domain-containing protein [Lachnoclostridium sp.]MCM1465139.1 GAF domain-containing protein [Bacteroidales bacterium]